MNIVLTNGKEWVNFLCIAVCLYRNNLDGLIGEFLSQRVGKTLSHSYMFMSRGFIMNVLCNKKFFEECQDQRS